MIDSDAEKLVMTDTFKVKTTSISACFNEIYETEADLQKHNFKQF